MLGHYRCQGAAGTAHRHGTADACCQYTHMQLPPDETACCRCRPAEDIVCCQSGTPAAVDVAAAAAVTATAKLIAAGAGPAARCATL